MIFVKREKDNPEVTNFYLDTIVDSIKKNDSEIMNFETFKGLHVTNEDTIIVSYAPDVLKALIKRPKHILFWSQGVWPEESYMKHSSKIRYLVTSLIEKIAIKKSTFTFYVSEQMRIYYKKKYNIDKKNYYIMPCINESIHKKSFFEKNKYSDNTFCYVGSTAKWQCFEETVLLYSKIEKINPNTKLLLLVKDRNYATEILNKYNVRNYEIDFVNVEQLEEKLSKVKYGFIIRKNNPVNVVATPTKNSTYLSNGIIPIISNCLTGLKESIMTSDFYIDIGENIDETVKKITNNINKKINPDDIYQDYLKIFNTNYNRTYHVKKIKKIMEEKNII